MIGVGVIGTGFGRAVHVPALGMIPGARVVAIASANAERARRAAEEASIPQWYASWRELVDSPDVAAVTIATPPDTHFEIAGYALASRKPVLCEKPLAHIAADAVKLALLARSVGCANLVAFEFRYVPAFTFLRDHVADLVGRVHHVSVNWSVASWSDPNRPWSWRSDLRRGGGILGTFGVHVFDYIEWLFGPVRTVAAQYGVRIGARPDAEGRLRPVTAPDTCSLLMSLADGAPAAVTLTVAAAHPVGHWIEAWGERGGVVLGSTDLSYGSGYDVKTARGELVFRDEAAPGADGRVTPFAALARVFVDAVSGGGLDGGPSFADGARAQVIADLADRSTREGRLTVPEQVQEESTHS